MFWLLPYACPLICKDSQFSHCKNRDDLKKGPVWKVVPRTCSDFWCFAGQGGPEFFLLISKHSIRDRQGVSVAINYFYHGVESLAALLAAVYYNNYLCSSSSSAVCMKHSSCKASGACAACTSSRSRAPRRRTAASSCPKISNNSQSEHMSRPILS